MNVSVSLSSLRARLNRNSLVSLVSDAVLRFFEQNEQKRRDSRFAFTGGMRLERGPRPREIESHCAEAACPATQHLKGTAFANDGCEHFRCEST